MIPARWHGGSQKPSLIVIHSTVTACSDGAALAVAKMFSDEINETSAHYVVGPTARYQCVGDHVVAYHCGYNQNSIGIEMTDMPVGQPANITVGSKKWFAIKSAWRWTKPEQKKLLENAAKLTAELCLAYDIKPMWLGKKKLPMWNEGRATGITVHALMSSTFHKSTHWDPGWWPRKRFIKLVNAECNRLRKAAK